MGYAGEVEWMNQEGNCLLGFLNEREKWANNGFMSLGKDGSYRAWWQQEGFKGGYPGAIPVSDLYTRMLNWQPQECTRILVAKEVWPSPVMEVEYDDETVDEDGVKHYWKWVADTERKALVRPDTDVIFGYVGRDTYQMNDYRNLVETCGNIADGELGIASAFMMDKGGVFIVNMELPEDITTEAGIDHRVRMMACSSHNQRFVNLWKLVDEFCVCSNSFRLNLSKAGNEFRAKHTSKSHLRIADARQALGLVYKASEEYSKFLDAMTKVDVTDSEFTRIINGMFPMPQPVIEATTTGQRVKNQGAITRMEQRHAELMANFRGPTADKWAGSLFAAFQGWSTWNQHERPRGDALAANIMGTLDGRIEDQDAEFWKIVTGIETINLKPLVGLAIG